MPTFRRGKRSAALPAGIISTRTGRISNRPTRPSAHGSPVRSYSSQPMATEMIWAPVYEAILPIAKERTYGFRRASKASRLDAGGCSDTQTPPVAVRLVLHLAGTSLPDFVFARQV